MDFRRASDRGRHGGVRSRASRSALATYLPAFYIAGAMCLVAALIALAIRRGPTADLRHPTPVPARAASPARSQR
jgi:hypothetical protein